MKFKISVQKESEKLKLTAYFLGAMRDGSFIKNEKNFIYRVRIYQKNKEWIENLAGIAEKLFNKKPTIVLDKRDNVWSLIINSKSIYESVINISDYQENQIEWNTPNFILKSSFDVQREYIKGFFDSEGGVPHVEERKVEPKNIRIHFTQSNMKCLEELRMMIRKLGIKTGNVCGPYYKKGFENPIFRLKIHGTREVSKFADIVGSYHKEKLNRLSIISKQIQ